MRLSVYVILLLLLGCTTSKDKHPQNSESIITKPKNEIKIESETNVKPITLIGTKWGLIELLGKPIDNSRLIKKDPYLYFLENNRFSSHAGCNMLNGEFKTDFTKTLTFSKTISTMMACPDMSLENDFKLVLEQADSFVVADSILVLSKAKKAPLAKFISLEKK